MPVHDRKMTLGVFYLSYPGDCCRRDERPLHELKKILNRFQCTKKVFIIDNSAPAGSVLRVGENEFELGGDNRFWEFSGWQKGIDFAREEGVVCDAFLFANDMFLHSSFFHRPLVNQYAFECALNHNALVGKPMRLCVQGEIMGHAVIPHVRTHLFLLSARAMDSLGTLVSISPQKMERFFLPAYDPSRRLFRDDAPLSAEVKDFIFAYITRRWHRRRPYTPQYFDLLRGKATAIINSLLLSMRPRQLGIPLIPYNKAGAYRSLSFEAGHLDRLWLSGCQAPSESLATPRNKFWDRVLPRYLRVQKKQPAWAELKIFSKTNSVPEHM